MIVLARNEYEEVGLTFAWPVDTIELRLKLRIWKCFIQKSKNLDAFVARGLYINVLSAASKINLGKYLLETQWHIHNNAKHHNCHFVI